MPMLMTWWGPWWPHRPHNPPPLRLNIPQLTFATRLHWWYLNIWRLGMSNILLDASNIYFQHRLMTYFLLSGANNMSLDILVILLANLFVYRCNKNDFCSALTPKTAISAFGTQQSYTDSIWTCGVCLCNSVELTSQEGLTIPDVKMCTKLKNNGEVRFILKLKHCISFYATLYFY